MNHKFEVYAWGKKAEESKREYHFVWGGRSLIKAIFHAWYAKGYSGCVKIEWRGTR